MKHLIAGLLFFSVVVAAVMVLGQCSAPAAVPDAPAVELDVDIDRAKPRKTLTPKPVPKATAKPKTAAPAPKGTKR